MATCDPQTLLNDGSCFLCLSEKELNVAVAQLLCDIASGGVPCACENLGGADSPLNNTTPDFIGQVYVQDSGVVWQAGSLLSSSWTVLCDPSGGGGGMIWGPDATELDFFIWSNGTFPDGGNFDTQPITSLVFPGLTVVTHDFNFSGDSELVEVSAPSLQSAENIVGDTCDNLGSVDFRSLTGVTSDLLINSNQSLTAVNLDSLETVPGNLSLYDCLGLTALSFPALNDVGTLDVSGDPVLAVLTLPLLAHAVDLVLNDCAFITLSFPSLVTVDDELICDNNSITSIDLPLLVTVPNFSAHDNQLTHVNAPNLVVDAIASGTAFFDLTNNALDAATVEFFLHVAVLGGWNGAGFVLWLDGGTNAGLASLSVQGQADYATLFAAGVTITINP